MIRTLIAAILLDLAGRMVPVDHPDATAIHTGLSVLIDRLNILFRVAS